MWGAVTRPLNLAWARAITGGVDTHADVHIAAALDPIGGLLGVQESPATQSQPRRRSEGDGSAWMRAA